MKENQIIQDRCGVYWKITSYAEVESVPSARIEPVNTPENRGSKFISIRDLKKYYRNI